ncbi:MAG: anti-sigma factor domain-containing protein [Acidimicrobiales bacterium]
MVLMAAQGRTKPTSWYRPVLSAAAALVLVAATVAVTTQLSNDSDTSDGNVGSLHGLALAARDAPGSQVMALHGSAGQAQVVVDGSGNGYLLGEGLQPLPKEQTYQLWSVGGEAPVSLGVLGPHPQVAAFSASGVRSMALSVEPAGGAAAPTFPPVATSGV